MILNLARFLYSKMKKKNTNNNNAKEDLKECPNVYSFADQIELFNNNKQEIVNKNLRYLMMQSHNF